MVAVAHWDGGPEGRRAVPGASAVRRAPATAAVPGHRCSARPAGTAPAARRAVGVAALLVVLGGALTGLALLGGLPAPGPLATRASRRGPAAVIAAPGGAVPVAARVYVVRPGDTLWGIAGRLEPGRDPRPLVYALSRQVPGGVLQVGERLVLPVGG